MEIIIPELGPFHLVYLWTLTLHLYLELLVPISFDTRMDKSNVSN